MSDLADFGLLVEEHQKSIRAFVAVRINDPYEAQDIAQEVFLVAYRRLGEIDQSRPLRPWLYGIASNLVRNHNRKHRPISLGSAEGNILKLLEREFDSTESKWQDALIFDALDSCLAKVGDEARDLLRLRYEEGLEISQIRASHGGKHSTITMRLFRVREQLRLCIERQMGGVNHG